MKNSNSTIAWQEVVLRILRVDTGLNGVTKQRNVFLVLDWKLLTSCNSELPLNKIHSSNFLSDRMLNLQTSVHLHEEEILSIVIEDEFNGTCIHVINSFCSVNRCLTHLSSQHFTNVRWCLLNNLLVSSLHRAVTLIQVNIITVHITENLELDMSRILNVLFDKHIVISKTFHGFSFGLIEHLEEVFFSTNNSHTFATATKNCLKHDWEANFLGFVKQELWVLIFTMITRDYGNISSAHNVLGHRL
mmetsp:Transcript_94283/g.129880  ORF Transcript_94283/g.129880 Transcript_94283/m.129880 type:complete len:246 (-) Transcript_94283:217-954(-)